MSRLVEQVADIGRPALGAGGEPRGGREIDHAPLLGQGEAEELARTVAGDAPNDRVRDSGERGSHVVLSLDGLGAL